MPNRLQRRRTKGWQAPPGAVHVARGTVFGDPFVCADPLLAVAAYRVWLARGRVALPEGVTCAGGCAAVDRERVLRHLRERRSEAA